MKEYYETGANKHGRLDIKKKTAAVVVHANMMA